MSATPAHAPVLELENVVKEYRGAPPVRALDDVSLTVSSGDFLGITGASGSGKSTLLNVMGTLAQPSTGKVLIDGLDVSDVQDRTLTGVRANHIGFVFQQFHLIPGLTALDNVALGSVYTGMVRRTRRTLAGTALERVGLSHRTGHRPAQLSGGERQRVAIARALIGEPSLILADEPTGNLDSRTSAGIMDLLEELHTDGATLVVITHDPEVAARARRRVELVDGRVATADVPAAP